MASSLQSTGPVRLPRSFSRRCRIRCQIWAGESSGAICRSFLTASCVPLGPYFIPTTRTWSICGNQRKGWFAFLPLGSGPSSMSTSHCKSSALSSCDHVPNSWAPACDCANQSRGTAFVSASCLPKPGCGDCGHSSSSHLHKVISATRAPAWASPAPVLLTNKTKLLHLIELKDYRVKAGRRKCARGYACPGFAGRRVPFGKSLNGWPGPHVGSPLPTLTPVARRTTLCPGSPRPTRRMSLRYFGCCSSQCGNLFVQFIASVSSILNLRTLYCFPSHQRRG